MRIPFPLIVGIMISLCFHLPSVAQKKGEKEVNMLSYKISQTIKLPVTGKKYYPSIAVSDVKVYDVRFDTVSLGFIEHASFPANKLIAFNKPTCVAVQEYFESLISFTSPETDPGSYTLVCFIKKLFLSDKFYLDGNRQASSSELNYEIKSGAIAFFEFYAQQGEKYIPLYLFDSTITGSKKLYDNSKHYLEDILLASLQKLEKINPEKVKTYNNPKSLAAIAAYNNERFNIAILKEKPRKGLYLNFEIFRNNTPLDTAFTIDKGSKGDFLYVKNEKGEDILQTGLWGYSDGTSQYIFSAENYYKLSRYCNSFIIYGAKGFSSSRKLRLNFGLLDAAMPNSNYAKGRTSNSYELVSSLNQLDMETGELY